MMFKTDQLVVVGLVCAASAMALGCSATDGGSQTDEAKLPPAAEAEYLTQIGQLKEAASPDYDRQLDQLKERYGIPRSEMHPELLQDSPAKQLVAQGQDSKIQALAGAGEVYTLTYPVAQPYQDVRYLVAGEVVDWYTQGGAQGIDTVMVLFQYDNAQFKSSGSLPNSAVSTLKIFGYNDDIGGGDYHSRMTTQIATAGWYVIMVYPYTYGSSGVVQLVKQGCKPDGPLCQGPNCLPPTQTCYGDQPISIAIGGTAVRNVAMDAMLTNNNTGGADPRLFAFNLTDLKNGAANDDYLGVNSRIDLGADFRFTGAGANAVLLSGYNTAGSATFHGYKR